MYKQTKTNRKEIIIPESKFEESRLIFFDKWKDPKKNIVTNEVIKFLIDCATSFYDEMEFENNIDYNSIEWIESLDLRISQIRKTN